MKKEFSSIYENGLFRPLEPIELADQRQVLLTVQTDEGDDWLDRDAVDWARQEGDPHIPLEEVRRRLAGLSGSLADLVISERGDY